MDLCCDRPEGQTIVSVAREWIGTPYIHQASCKQTGTDCLGLLRGIWRETIGEERELPGPYSPDWDEPGGTEPLMDGLARHLKLIEPWLAEAGDVLVFRMLQRCAAKHLAILSSRNIEVPNASIIHAYSGLSVVETRLSPPWCRRIVGAFRLPVKEHRVNCR